jgi:hypothetical protein
MNLEYNYKSLDSAHIAADLLASKGYAVSVQCTHHGDSKSIFTVTAAKTPE